MTPWVGTFDGTARLLRFEFYFRHGLEIVVCFVCA